jgi:hypothetical protein
MSLDEFKALETGAKGEYLESLDTPSLIRFCLTYLANGYDSDDLLGAAQWLDIG